LLERKRDGGPLRGSWDLPAATPKPDESSFLALKREMKQRHGLKLERGLATARITHTILATKLSIDVVATDCEGSGRSGVLRWTTIADLRDVATSSATLKAAQKRSQVSRGTSPSTRSASSSSSAARSNA
jgi:8-oxo-dGTP pyrophosphatase MutT (NUDIX family)